MTTTIDAGPNASLAERIAWASIQVGAFEPDKRNKEQNYDYISADAVLARGGHALATNGVSVVPSITSAEITPTKYTTRSGNESTRHDARVVFSVFVTCGDKPADGLTIQWFGFGSDYTTPDKAFFKAVTSGHKYFLMKLLNIGAGNEDGEHENPPAESERVSSTTANAKRAELDKRVAATNAAVNAKTATVVNTSAPTPPPPAAEPTTPTPPPTMNQRADANESEIIRTFIKNSGAAPEDVEMFFGAPNVTAIKTWAKKNRKTIAETLAAFGKFLKDGPPAVTATDESEIPF